MRIARRRPLVLKPNTDNLKVHKTITISLGLLSKLDPSLPIVHYVEQGLIAEDWHEKAIRAEATARDYEDRYKSFSSVLQAVEAAHPDLKDEIAKGFRDYKLKQIEESSKLDLLE